jgi:hypothetical protein
VNGHADLYIGSNTSLFERDFVDLNWDSVLVPQLRDNVLERLIRVVEAGLMKRASEGLLDYFRR